jgi:hypothetical protein
MSLGSIAFCPTASGETEAPSLQYSAPEPVKGSVAADFAVGEVRLSHSDMTEDELEAAIQRAGIAMQSWYARFQQSKLPADLDTAYRHMGQQRTLIARRSPAQIARMEQERGLI